MQSDSMTWDRNYTSKRDHPSELFLQYLSEDDPLLDFAGRDHLSIKKRLLLTSSRNIRPKKSRVMDKSGMYKEVTIMLKLLFVAMFCSQAMTIITATTTDIRTPHSVKGMYWFL